MAGTIRVATPEDTAGIAAVHVRAAEAADRGLEPDGWLDGRPLPLRLAYW